MNIKDLNNKLLFNDRIVAVAGLTKDERELLDWMRMVYKRHKGDDSDFVMPPHTKEAVRSVMSKLVRVGANLDDYFGFETIRQLDKDGFYIMDKKGKIVGRFERVDDKI